MDKNILMNSTILFVEDEDELREFTCNTLNSIFKKVYACKDGHDGLETFKNNKDIDLVLTDIKMPRIDGVEMSSEIRKLDKQIPIIVVSAYTDLDFVKESLDIDISDYMIKPIDLYKLVKKMQKALKPVFLINKVKEEKIENNLTEIKNLLDKQENPLLLIKDMQIVEVNDKLLDFFDIKKLDDFLHTINENWLSKLLRQYRSKDTITLKNSLMKDIKFSIHLNSINEDDKFFLLSLDDIGIYDEVSNLLEYKHNFDHITGLFNQIRTTEILRKEIKRDIRYGNDLSAIMIDIKDSFINKERQLSDTLLKNIAKNLLKNIREFDTISRWSEYKFLIILPQTKVEDALKVAEKIEYSLNEIEELKKLFAVAQLDKNDDETTLILRLNNALVDSKEKGKFKIA